MKALGLSCVDDEASARQMINNSVAFDTDTNYRFIKQPMAMVRVFSIDTNSRKYTGFDPPDRHEFALTKSSLKVSKTK